MAKTAVNLSTRGRLYEPHARSYERMKIEVYLNHGWVLEPTNANGTTLRPYADQVAIFKQNYTNYPNGSPAVQWDGKNWYRRPGAPSTAKPGTSNHGNGNTVDFAGLGGFGGTRYKQLAAIAPHHGWSNREGRSVNEAWHWNHFPASDMRAKTKGWFHVKRLSRTRTYTSKGVKGTVRPWRFPVYINGTVVWGGRTWGVTNYGNLYAMDHLSPGKAPKFKPGWFHVDPSKKVWNGRDKTLKKVLYKRKGGFNIYAKTVETRGSHTYVVTNYGTYYRADGLRLGRAKK